MRGGRRRRVRPDPPRRLRHADRRARHQPLRRPAAAGRARARARHRARASSCSTIRSRPSTRSPSGGSSRASAPRSPAGPFSSPRSASRRSTIADRAVVLRRRADRRVGQAGRPAARGRGRSRRSSGTRWSPREAPLEVHGGPQEVRRADGARRRRQRRRADRRLAARPECDRQGHHRATTSTI